MAAPKRTKQQRLTDLVFIEKLFASGFTHDVIADRLNAERPYSLARPTISRDIDEILDSWRQTLVENIDELQAQELLRINQIEREAWKAWERSKGKRERRLSERKTGGKESGQRDQNITEDQVGDPRYLEQVQWCITKRCDILGLNAPRKYQHSGPGGGPIETNARHSLDLSKCTTQELTMLRTLVSRQ